MIVELDENNFNETVLKGLKLVEFYTDWCGYCVRQNAILEEMQDITIYRVNGDKSPSLLEKCGVHSFPSFVVFKDGKQVNLYLGLHTKFELMNILTKYMK